MKRGTMTKKEALKILENMPENEFQEWFKSLPYRVQYSCPVIGWKEILPEWYIKTNSLTN